MTTVNDTYDRYTNSGLLFCEREQSPMELPCCNVVYSSQNPSQIAGEASCTTPVRLDWYPISLSWSYAHISPHLNSQFKPSVGLLVILSQSHVSSAVWVLNGKVIFPNKLKDLSDLCEWHTYSTPVLGLSSALHVKWEHLQWLIWAILTYLCLLE